MYQTRAIERPLHLYLILYPEVERLLHFGDYQPDYENNRLLQGSLVPEPTTQQHWNTIRCLAVNIVMFWLEKIQILFICKPNKAKFIIIYQVHS